MEKSIVSLDLSRSKRNCMVLTAVITHKFVKDYTLKMTICMNKVTKNLWYDIKKQPKYTKTLLKLGYKWTQMDMSPGDDATYLEIYEGNIPPLCCVIFHISQIFSPSGWINIA